VEFDSRRAAMAREHFRQAGVADQVTVTIGDARDILSQRADGSFDAVFIDADKEPYPRYYQEGVRLVRSGGLILADNVLSHGRVATAEGGLVSSSLEAIRRYNETAATDPQVLATILPVGDGLGVALKLGPGP
jgi:caffeoyl-CoA O-methyltransferase